MGRLTKHHDGTGGFLPPQLAQHAFAWPTVVGSKGVRRHSKRVLDLLYRDGVGPATAGVI